MVVACGRRGRSHVGDVFAADRFWRGDGGLWIDLATGDRVALARLPAAEPPDEARWVDRCSALAGLWHPHLLAIVDFGTAGPRRFEAWAVCRPWRRRGDRAVAFALRSVVAFLHACGVSAGRPGWRRLGDDDGRPVLVPDAATGRAFDTGDEEVARREGAAWAGWLDARDDLPGARVAGVRLQNRAAHRWILDLLDDVAPGGPRRVRVRGVPGAGLGTFVRSVAREARRRGFVPFDAGVARRYPQTVAAVQGRHVLLIEHDDAPGTSPLLALGRQSARGHVVLRLERVVEMEEPATADRPGVLDLDPLPPETLMEMVTVYPPDAVDASDIRRAALEAGGWPGGFLARLLGDDRLVRPSRRAIWMVHESRGAYLADARPGPEESTRDTAQLADGPGADSAQVESAWPELERAQARVRTGMALAARGRHAAALRALRAAVRSLEQRGAEAVAAASRLALAEVLAARGRAAEALGWLEPAAEQGTLDVRLRIAIAVAELRIDEAKLAEGEAAARAAQLASDQEGVRLRRAEAALAVVRSLFWQGRLEEARDALPSVEGLDASTRGRRHAWQARVAVARGDLLVAGRAAAEALHAAETLDEPVAQARAWRAKGEVAAQAGDPEAFREAIARARAAARRARRPLAILRADLLAAWGSARLGLGADHARAARALARWQRRALPALLRRRVEDGMDRERTREQGPCGPAGAAVGGDGWPSLDELHAISDLHRICHETIDDRAALDQVARALRDRLRALGVEIMGVSGDGLACLAGAGARAPGERGTLGDRIVATGLVIPPTLGPGGIEAGAPVWYAGSTVGAVTVRWTVDRAVDVARAGRVLAAASAACAPRVRAALDRQAAPTPDRSATPALLGISSAMALVRDQVARAARVPFSVLIEGESGSGKELVARVIHQSSPRRDRPFCALNCAALADDLVEAELFGHTRGAFTGAVAERAGLFEDAHLGTLLLDEVAELSPRAQAKLLRAIQDGEVRRLGENMPRRVDVRLLAASNRRLEDEVAAGRFRADLRYRLDVIRIVVPPLRERPEDVASLALHFWAEVTARTGSRATLAPELLAALARYDWPGNVRELQNVMAALAAAAGPRGRVGPRDLPAVLARRLDVPAALTLDEARTAFERRYVRATLARVAGHRGLAARTLGVSRQGLAKLLRRLDIDAAPERTRRHEAS